METHTVFRFLAMTVAIGLGSGCALQLPAPQVLRVVPDRGWQGEETEVEIRGWDFNPAVFFDTTGSDGDLVDDEFIVHLAGPTDTPAVAGIHEVQDVRLRNSNLLTADVPSGLPLGVYDLIVEGPSGETGALENAYTVSPDKADHLYVTSDRVTYEVNEVAFLEIELQDPNDDVVLDEPFLVIVEVTSEGGSVAPVFLPDGLEDQESFTTASITGNLGNDGRASVGMTLTTPETITVNVRPANSHPPDGSVDAGETRIEFEPGNNLGVQIRLPNENFEVAAGETFEVELQLVDQFDNPVFDANETVFLQNACGGFLIDVSPLTGFKRVPIGLSKATGLNASCPFDRIRTFIGPTGESEPISVTPAEVDSFDVFAGPGAVVAGSNLLAVVTPKDVYGNTTTWDSTDNQLTVQDTMDGVVGGNCAQTPPFVCEAPSTVAGDAVQLRVTDANSVEGLSNIYAVIPGVASAMSMELQGGDAIAGVPIPVALSVVDVFGNLLHPDDLPAIDFEFSSNAEIPECVASTTPPDSRAWFDCVFKTAITDTTVRAAYLPTALSTQSPNTINVLNGPLAQVTVAHPGSAVAGSPVSVNFTGFDTYGNRYLEQTTTLLDVADSGGSMSIGIVDLNAAGEATATATFTLAGSTVISASQALAPLGDSAALAISADVPASFAFVAPAWVWVGTAEPIVLRALDQFGNVADYDGVATVNSVVSPDHVDVPFTLTDGVGSEDLTWTIATPDDGLIASDGTLVGASAPISAVEDCGVGPTIDLEFGTYTEAIACFTGGEGLISGGLGLSVPDAGHTITQYGLSIDGGESQLLTTPDLLVKVFAPGAYTVRGMVVQDNGCAAEVPAPAWIGPNDGSPVGPISLQSADASIDAGVDSTVINVVGAVDCGRDPAGGGRVYLRSDRGTIVAPGGETGQGMRITLDPAGDGSAVLDAIGVRSPGTATVYAWLDSGAGGGETTVEIEQDKRAPVVWQQTPRGDTSGAVSVIEVLFSEPILTASVSPLSFQVTGPSAVTITDAQLTDADRVELTLDGPVTSEAGVWTLTVGDNIRDEAQGNKLDGAYLGVLGGSDYTGTFGDLPTTVDNVIDCTPAEPVFRPDGDDSALAGPELDLLAVSLGSATAPAFWVVSIEDTVGTLLYRERVPAADAIDTWVWDGRDIGEQIVDNGDYTIIVESDDGMGNRGNACQAVVTVDNHLGAQ